MMKHLYKTLLIALISGSLLTVDMVAFAQQSGGGSTQTQTSKSGYYKDSEGVLRKNKTEHFGGTKNSDNVMTTITMLAVGLVGTRLMTYTKWTTDMTIAAVASGLYVASEVMNLMNSKKQMDPTTIELSKRYDGKVDQAQIETLEKLKESYQNAQKAAENKKKFQDAATMAYLAALATAVYLRFTEDGQLASCQTGIASALGALKTCTVEKMAAAAAAATNPGTAALVAGLKKEAADCTTCAGEVQALSTLITTIKTTSEVPAKSAAQKAEVGTMETTATTQATAPCTGVVASGIKTSMVTSSCSTYLVKQNLNQGYGANFVAFNNSAMDKFLYANVTEPQKNYSHDSTLEHRSLVQKLLNFFIPRAEAGMANLFGLAAGAAAALTAAQLGISEFVDSYMFTPGKRMIVWAMMAGAAKMGSSATQEEIDKIKGYIKDIDKILAEYSMMKKGIAMAKTADQYALMASMGQQEVQLSNDPKIKTDCIKSASGNSGQCASISNSIQNLPDFAGLPDSLKVYAKQVAGIGDGLSGASSVSASTMGAINSLGQSKAIGKIADTLKNKLNSNLQKSGKAPVDYDKKSKEVFAHLKKRAEKGLASKGMTAGGFLSSVGLSPISSNAMAAMNAPATTSSKKSEPVVSGPSGSAAKNDDFNLDFKEASGELAAAETGATATTENESYDIGTNDIHTDSSESIFQIISNRYIRSGYTKLLEEIPVKQ